MTKTASRLRREIAYFSGLILRTASRDRIRRADMAIRLRERQLQDVLMARASQPTQERRA